MKIDFIMQIFEYCLMTQTVIFINTKSFALKVFEILKSKNYKPAIIFGDMTAQERDEFV